MEEGGRRKGKSQNNEMVKKKEKRKIDFDAVAGISPRVRRKRGGSHIACLSRKEGRKR